MTDALALFDIDAVAPVDPEHVGDLYLGRCQHLNAGHACTHTTARRGAPERGAACPKHGMVLKWRKVEGHHAAGIRCNADCQYARGPLCSCSCAGANHGAGYIPRGAATPTTDHHHD